MMFVRLNNNGQVLKFPFKPEQLRRLHPNISFPSIFSKEILENYNVFPVVQTAAPRINSELETVTTGVERVDGSWSLKYTVVPRLKEDLEQQVHSRAEQKLSDTLDLVIKYVEVNKPVPENISSYRKALRDIHLQDGYPYEVEWPRLFKDTESSGA